MQNDAHRWLIIARTMWQNPNSSDSLFSCYKTLSGTAEPPKVSGCVLHGVRTWLTLQKPWSSCTFKSSFAN